MRANQTSQQAWMSCPNLQLTGVGVKSGRGRVKRAAAVLWIDPFDPPAQLMFVPAL